MATDFEALAQAFLNGKRPQNIDSLKSMLSTEENKKIISNAVGDGATLKRTLCDMQRGNTDSAKTLIDSISKTPGGKELISKILHAVEEQK